MADLNVIVRTEEDDEEIRRDSEQIMNELNLTPDDNHYGFAMQTANEIMKKGMGQFWEARKEIIEDLHNFREDQAKRSMDNALLLRNAISRMHQRRLRIEKLEKKIRLWEYNGHPCEFDMEESAEWDRALNEMHERIKMEKTFMEEDRAQAKGLADSIGWSLNGL